MIYYRCKCGKNQALGSIGPAKCDGCSICNTTLTTHPDYHKTPEPHEFVIKYDENTGKPYRICINCNRKEEDIKKEIKEV